VSSSSTFFICPLASWIRLPLVKWAGWESAGVSRYLPPPPPNLGPLSLESPSPAGVSLELNEHCFSFSCFGCCTLFSWVGPSLSCCSCSCNLCRCHGLPPLSGEWGAFRFKPAEAVGGRSAVGWGRGGSGWKEEGPYWGRWYGILTGRESREGWKAGRGKYAVEGKGKGGGPKGDEVWSKAARYNWFRSSSAACSGPGEKLCAVLGSAGCGEEPIGCGEEPTEGCGEDQGEPLSRGALCRGELPWWRGDARS